MQKNDISYFSVRDKYFAYDVNTTVCAEVDHMALTILPELLSGTNKNIEKKYGDIYPQSQLRACLRECRELLESEGFGVQPAAFQHTANSNIAAVCLHVAHHCNLRCEYCYADTGAFGGRRFFMNRRVLRQAIDFTFAHSGNHKKVNVGFFGGEPLLVFDLIREGVEYAKQKAKSLNKRVTFSMASNAVLLTPRIMEFLGRENFSLLFSLDGPKATHDRMRKTAARQGTHARVLQNIKDYARRFSKTFTVRGTFTRTTPSFSEQVLYLNDQGFKSISVEPAQLAETHPHAIFTEKDMDRVRLEYDYLADQYLQRLEQGHPLSFYHFDHCLRQLLRPQPVHTECGAGCGYIAVTPDGRIFPCFETVAEKQNCIGHIDSGFQTRKRKAFQCMHVDAKEECRACWAKYLCGGGCHAFNIRFNHDLKIPYRPQCELIKHRFKLSAWLLSEITDRGEKLLKKLETHLWAPSDLPHGHAS